MVRGKKKFSGEKRPDRFLGSGIKSDGFRFLCFISHLWEEKGSLILNPRIKEWHTHNHWILCGSHSERKAVEKHYQLLKPLAKVSVHQGSQRLNKRQNSRVCTLLLKIFLRPVTHGGGTSTKAAGGCTGVIIFLPGPAQPPGPSSWCSFCRRLHTSPR